MEDGSARFLTQNDTVFFKDGEYEAIEWQYAPLADGKDVCSCEAWAIAFSTTSPDVWKSLSGEPVNKSCMGCMRSELTMTLDPDEWVMYDLPHDGSWLWLGVKQIGASSGSNAVETALAPVRVCFLMKSSAAAVLSFGKVVVVGGKAVLEVSWDQAQLNASQCCSLVPQLFVRGDNITQSSVALVHNNARVVLDESQLGTTSASTCQLSVAVKEQSTMDFATFDVVRCNETQGKVLADANTGHNNGTWWHGEWVAQWAAVECDGGSDVDWASSCGVVVDVVLVSVEHGDVVLNTTLDATTLDGQVFGVDVVFVVDEDKHGTQGVVGSFVAKVVIGATGAVLDTSAQHNHTFCNGQPPVFNSTIVVLDADSSTTSVAPSSEEDSVFVVVCGGGEEGKDVVVAVPGVADWGTACGQAVEQRTWLSSTTLNVSKSAEDEGTWRVRVACPLPQTTSTHEVCEEHSVMFGASNGAAQATAQATLRVCLEAHDSSIISGTDSSGSNSMSSIHTDSNSMSSIHTDSNSMSSSHIDSNSMSNSHTDSNSTSSSHTTNSISNVVDFTNVTFTFEDTNVTKDAIVGGIVSLVGGGVEDKIVSVNIENDGDKLVVVVVMKDEDAAQEVADAINNLDKGEGCALGVLCKATDVFIGTEASPSAGILCASWLAAVLAALFVAAARL